MNMVALNSLVASSPHEWPIKNFPDIARLGESADSLSAA